MAITPRERVLAALKQESLDRPPVACFTTCDTIGMMEKSGASWPEAHSDPKLMAKLGCAQADYFGLESVRAGFCLTEEAEALGCDVNMGNSRASPMLRSHAFNYNPMIQEYDDPSQLVDMDEFLNAKRIKATIDAMSIMHRTHGEEYVVIAGQTGPFTVAGHLLNTENLIYSVWTDPDMAKKWVAAVTPYCKAFAEELFANGAEAITMSEPSASTDILSPENFKEHSACYVKECLGSLSGNSVLHICGDTSEIIPFMYDTGVTGISVEEKVEPKKAVEIANKRGAIVGNVGCAMPLFKGTPQEVEASAKASRDAGFNIISAGCGVPIGTPDANILALVHAIKG